MFKNFIRRFHCISKLNNMYQESNMHQVNPNYEEAIKTLNTLQSNSKSLTDQNKNTASNPVEKLEKVRKYINRTGLTSNDISKLPVIHVSGTKGKGSTCAFCESILRHHGYKTGFFSSPHLLEVRERIRINGVPISKAIFSEFFWKIYESLNDQKDNPGDMPFYFQFLFIMAVHIFLHKKVEVAIIEVGIGGEYDPTNIVTCVPVAGITSLGFDHTSVLGNTIESISWNKAGIMKPGSKVFTVTQPEKAYNVLSQRSVERQCSLCVVDNALNIPIMTKYPRSIQTNISLAIQMAEAWMLSNPPDANNKTLLDIDVLKRSIEECQWPGRYEIRQEKNMRYYIDGAHTLESIAICIEWYLNDLKNRHGKKVLLFNLTGGRNCEDFFKLLLKCQFDTVIFVPNAATSSNESADNINLVLPVGDQLSNCYTYKDKWSNMSSNEGDVQVFPSVQDAVNYMNNEEKYNVLATGSLHLVGAVLTLLNPNLNEGMDYAIP
ncbi:hypothetical protein WA026_010142 [Henosepilachna vigintioctopunctata]|uniref:Folylpolyglutamate synthase n=1 Tax=Henosepilachna vigintioctopunctata TaxID=420089 RepID=A0AAW1UHU7_9CUCU